MFQSTHPQGVRRREAEDCRDGNCFNPRTRKGCDPIRKGQGGVPQCFNPRTRKGCDGGGAGGHRTGVFQSTHPQGVRRFEPSEIGLKIMFQSTHPQGVRPLPKYLTSHARTFQSTHPQGVRQLVPVLCKLLPPFQSTHPQGVRHRILEFHTKH